MRRTNPVKFLKAQPRFLTAALAGVVVWLILPRAWPPSTRLLVAWDCATGLYLVMALVMMLRSNPTKIRFRAAREDEGQLVVLGLTSITALISLGGIVAEMATAKAMKGPDEWHHLALSRSDRISFMDVYTYNIRNTLRT